MKVKKSFDLHGRPLEKVSNEFAMVRFAKATVGNGERLLLENPATGEFILLDPIVLEALIDLGTEELSNIVVTVRQ